MNPCRRRLDHAPASPTRWMIRGAPVMQTAHRHRQPVQMLADCRAIGGSDVLLAAAVSQPGISIAADTPSWAPPQVLDDLERYRIAHALTTCTIDAQTRLITGISLWRADPARPCTEPERQLMQAVFPHLIEARTQNRLIQLVQARRCAPLDRLTARGREVAVHTAQGLTHKEIARLLELPPATVRTHLASSCRRIGVRNKAQLAAVVNELE